MAQLLFYQIRKTHHEPVARRASNRCRHRTKTRDLRERSATTHTEASVDPRKYSRFRHQGQNFSRASTMCHWTWLSEKSVRPTDRQPCDQSFSPPHAN